MLECITADVFITDINVNDLVSALFGKIYLKNLIERNKKSVEFKNMEDANARTCS